MLHAVEENDYGRVRNLAGDAENARLAATGAQRRARDAVQEAFTTTEEASVTQTPASNILQADLDPFPDEVALGHDVPEPEGAATAPTVTAADVPAITPPETASTVAEPDAELPQLVTSSTEQPPAPGAVHAEPTSVAESATQGLEEAATSIDELASVSTIPRSPAPSFDDAPSPAAEPVWKALREQRLGLAYALVVSDALGPETPAIFAPTLKLAAAALAEDGTGAVYDDVGNAAEEILSAWSDDQAHDEHGLTALALLLPTLSSLAILTPGAFTSGLMRTVLAANINTAILHPLRDLARISDQSQAQLGQATGLLASLVSDEQWQAQVSEFAAETETWWDSQTKSQVRFAAATDLWRYMLRPDQTLGNWLQNIVSGDHSKAAAVRVALDGFTFERELRHLEPVVRGRPAAKRDPIDGPAYHALCKLGGDAIERVAKWLAMIARRPTQRRAAQDSAIATLRNELRLAIAAARQTLETLAPPIDAGAVLARRMLDRLEALIAAETFPPADRRFDERLGRELLACPGLRISADWQVLTPLGPQMLPSLSLLADSPPPAPREICGARLRDDDFTGAALALRLVSDDAEAAILRDDIDKAFATVAKTYATELDHAQRNIEAAERTGRLEAGLAQELLARIEAVRERLKVARPDQIDEAEACLTDAKTIAADTTTTLDQAKKSARERIRLRLERLVAAPAERAAITNALDDGQYAVAEDLVDRLEAGEPIDTTPTPTVEAVFDAFFPSRNQDLAAWRAAHGPVLRDFAQSHLAVPPGQDGPAQDLGTFIDAWTDCASEPFQQLARNLPVLLRQFGFTEPELVGAQTPRSGATEALFRMRARPLRERGTSVLPEFGSSANGSYALLCLWKRRDVQVITEALARQPAGVGPTIVLFFAPLDPSQRRRLGVLSRNGSLRSTIVIDELLALHLASLASGRLTALFANTLPFSDTQPWAETGTPPPEMFFGRQLELRDIEAPDGSGAHLIYGGRQLGKTALLRQVERNGAGNASIVACYLSIAQVGVASGVQSLWSVLADELARHGVTVAMGGADPARAFATSVRKWLDDVPARRIILLLDEADEFFRSDREGDAISPPFAVTRALSELTNNTNRRFKPVFAGLRNVQKLARDPNSPLAHLGTPRVIGPLMRGQERRQAEQLVRWPFAALGYRLADEVVTRILAFANYYPSLIQVVCQRLLRGVRERQGNIGPPWDITMDNVAAVLETRELRDAAYERFRITLELDTRYLLLTLVIAELSRNSPHMLASGIDARDLREYAASFWPEGFPADFSDNAFDALLSEMVGLGLLREIRGTHFALRSANLAHLIGSADKIKADLDAFYERPAPAEADPAQARRLIEGWPSLLTNQQEGVLLGNLLASRRTIETPGCLVLAGIGLADIGAAEAAIRGAVSASGKLPARGQIAVSNVTRIEPAHLRGLIERRKGAERAAIWFFRPETNWTADTVAIAAAALATLPPRNVPTRIVFIANADRAWAWCTSSERQSLLGAEDPRARVGELSAGPWSRTALDLWLKEHTELALPPQDILARTGGWDRAIFELRRNRAQTSEDLVRPRAESDPLADVVALDAVLPVLQALHEVTAATPDGEAITEDMLATWDRSITRGQVAHTFAWAHLVGAIQPGRGGPELNPLLRAALPRLVAK